MNPRLRDSPKELCDALVVFDHELVIVSVKSLRVRDVDEAVARRRWERRALTKSFKQLLGARRKLEGLDRIVDAESGRIVSLPPANARRVSLLSISLGGSRFGRYGSRIVDGTFVHILDDGALVPHFALLDTPKEFLGYLRARMQLGESHQAEEDLLGRFLLEREGLGRDPELTGQPGLAEYLATPIHELRPDLEIASLYWDALILRLWSERALHESNQLGDANEGAEDGELMENVLRRMALHTRAERRLLGLATLEFFGHDSASTARVLKVSRGPTYVLKRCASREHVADAFPELTLRCAYVQECFAPDRDAIGIASTKALATEGFAPVVLSCLVGSVGTSEFRDQLTAAMKEAGWFQELRMESPDREAFGLPDPDDG